MLISLGYNYNSVQLGLNKQYIWNTKKVPHLLIAGHTGGGKTVCAQLIIKQLLENKADVSIADFKAGGDWNGIVKNYGEYTDCDKILDSFYDSFTDAISRKKHHEKYLVFDEFSSYAISADSKKFKEIMAKVGHIAFMGRSFGYHILLLGQQINAKVLDTGIREQFVIKIHMGRSISTESATMLFTGCDIDKSVILPEYCGYISTPDKELDIIQMPCVSRLDKLKKLLIVKGNAN